MRFGATCVAIVNANFESMKIPAKFFYWLISVIVGLAMSSCHGVLSDSPSKYPELASLVGQRVSFEGVLQAGKNGWFLIGSKGRIYLSPQDGRDTTRLGKIASKRGEKLTCSGILRWQPFVATSESLGAPIIEHYYFRLAEVVIEK